ncbi:hypothetical protein RRSWK_03085 [Rhodopirellula sp. SWK7]|nr:hypothetical protein RRSWK_03085 [Rhodopirellula sp. SWK7]
MQGLKGRYNSATTLCSADNCVGPAGLGMGSGNQIPGINTPGNGRTGPPGLKTNHPKVANTKKRPKCRRAETPPPPKPGGLAQPMPGPPGPGHPTNPKPRPEGPIQSGQHRPANGKTGVTHFLSRPFVPSGFGEHTPTVAVPHCVQHQEPKALSARGRVSRKCVCIHGRDVHGTKRQCPASRRLLRPRTPPRAHPCKDRGGHLRRKTQSEHKQTHQRDKRIASQIWMARRLRSLHGEHLTKRPSRSIHRQSDAAPYQRTLPVRVSQPPLQTRNRVRRALRVGLTRSCIGPPGLGMVCGNQTPGVITPDISCSGPPGLRCKEC